MLPNSLYELDGEVKKLDAQSHKLEVNNSVVSVQTVLCVIVPYMSQYPFSAIDLFAPVTVAKAVGLSYAT